MSGKNLLQINHSEESILPNFKSEYWGPIAIVLLGLFMATISWQKWSDLIIDYGQQLYIPWQLSEGKVLYKDIHYLYGPLSSYLHAGLFKIFGTGIITLVWFNLILICLLTWIIYYLFLKISDQLTAMVVCLTFVGIFAFGQYALGGNYNFVCSYEYGLPHGIFLSFLGFLILDHFIKFGKSTSLMGLGFILGLIFLTKPEVFLAAFFAFILGLFLNYPAIDSQKIKKPFLLFFLLFLIPPLVTLLFLAQSMPIIDGLKSLFIPWDLILFSPIKSLPLYKWVFGTDALGANLSNAAILFMTFSFIFFSVIYLNILIHKIKRSQILLSITISLTLFIILLKYQEQIPLLELAAPWPIFLIFYLGFYSAKRSPLKQIQTIDVTLTLFSLLLLLKIFFKVHLYHYGFALALPATLVLIKIILFNIPTWVSQKFNKVAFYRTTTLTLVFAFIYLHVEFSNKIYSLKGFTVASGSDKIIDYYPEYDNRGVIFNEAQRYVNENLSNTNYLLSLPDAVIFNYLTKKQSPIGYINLNPAVWLAIGENKIHKQIKSSISDYIVLVDQEFPYFGAKHFGKDFGKPTFDWIKNNYKLEKQFGEVPFTGNGFGIQILKRREDNTQTHVG